MSDVERIKSEIFKTLESIDKGKLSLYDLKTYSEIFKIVAETKEEAHFESIMEKFMENTKDICCCSAPKTVSEMRWK